MQVGELKAYLEEYPDEAEIRVIYQKAWPFEAAILGTVSREDLGEHDQEDSGMKNETDVLIVTGEQICYGDKIAWELV